MYRIGQGTDIHRLIEGRKLLLGGIEIPHTLGLDGHSDADVLLHAIADALLGAVGKGDIGKHFPDTDPQWKNADSKKLLAKIWADISAENWTVENLDCTIHAEKPKLRDFIATIENSISTILQIKENSCINVKATTGEKLGFVGRQEGIMAEAVILLRKVNS